MSGGVNGEGQMGATGSVQVAVGQEFQPVARRLFGNVRLHFPEGRDGESRLVSTMLGDCRLSALQAATHTVFGDHVVAGSDDPDSLKLLIQTEGYSELEQNGRRAGIGGDAVVLYDPTRSYTLVNRTNVRLLLLQMPRQTFSSSALRALASPYCLRQTQTGLQRVLLSMMRTTMGELGQLDERMRANLGNTMVDLVKAMMEEGTEPSSPAPTSLDMLRARVKAYVEANLARPDLDIGEIARKMGCSPRYIFRAFEKERRTPAEYIWDLRLERAKAELARPDDRKRSISDIAFSLGFSSSAHFSRAFRARFELSPRDWRNLSAPS